MKVYMFACTVWFAMFRLSLNNFNTSVVLTVAGMEELNRSLKLEEGDGDNEGAGGHDNDGGPAQENGGGSGDGSDASAEAGAAEVLGGAKAAAGAGSGSEAGAAGGGDSDSSGDWEDDSAQDSPGLEVGQTGLPPQFSGDAVARHYNLSQRGNNNNKGEDVATVVDNWTRRFRAAYPDLQHVVRLSRQQRQYLDSLVYEHSETPAGDGRTYSGSIRHTAVPLTRLAVEGPPG